MTPPGSRRSGAADVMAQMPLLSGGGMPPPYIFT